MNIVYELTSEDISDSSVPMWAKSTIANFRKLFSDIEKAKKYAEDDFKKPIKWKKGSKGLTSGDLNYVIYNINEVNIY